jgi:hypothetical protein
VATAGNTQEGGVAAALGRTQARIGDCNEWKSSKRTDMITGPTGTELLIPIIADGARIQFSGRNQLIVPFLDHFDFIIL